MQFTGCTPFTSLSGVRREVRFFAPLQALALSVALVGRWTVGNLSLTFDDDSKIRQGRQTMTAQALRLGQNAVVMGYRLGDGSVRVRRLSVRTTAQNIGNSGGGGADAGAVGELSGDVPN